VFALYAFARTADDFADEPQFAGRRAEELDRWEDLLHRCAHGEAEHPVFVALAETIARCELPIGPLQDLLTAFRMDLRTRRYATARELHAYTAMAARPIGRLLLYVFGIRSAEHHRFADELSSALALTAFWQDVALDLARDRIYLPQEDLCHFGVTEADLFARRQTPQLGHLLRYECARTRAAFERARPLVNIVPDRLGVEVALMWFGGARALEKIEAQAGDVFGPRVALGRRDKALVLTRALAARGRGLLGR
jgi:squalene synthase HpnC